MLIFALGFIGGFVFAAICTSRLIVGRLTKVQDEDGTYPFMILKDHNIDNIFTKKYVVLKITDSQE